MFENPLTHVTKIIIKKIVSISTNTYKRSFYRNLLRVLKLPAFRKVLKLSAFIKVLKLYAFIKVLIVVNEKMSLVFAVLLRDFQFPILF